MSPISQYLGTQQYIASDGESYNLLVWRREDGLFQVSGWRGPREERRTYSETTGWWEQRQTAIAAMVARIEGQISIGGQGGTA